MPAGRASVVGSIRVKTTAHGAAIAFAAQCNNVGSRERLMTVDGARTEQTDPADAARRRFRELVEPELPRLYRLARRLVGEDAEDAVQDCLLNAYRKLG